MRLSLQKASLRCTVVAKFVAGRTDTMAGQRYAVFSASPDPSDVSVNPKAKLRRPLTWRRCGFGSDASGSPTTPLRAAEYQRNEEKPTTTTGRRGRDARRDYPAQGIYPRHLLHPQPRVPPPGPRLHGHAGRRCPDPHHVPQRPAPVAAALDAQRPAPARRQLYLLNHE